MRADQIASHIFIRDQFAHDRYVYAVRVLAAMVAILAISLSGNVALLYGREQFRYIMTNNMGRLLPLVPLAQPNREDDEIGRWAVDAVTRAYTFDFVNYRQQFTATQETLTGVGWDGFVDSLKKSNNFVAITDNRYVTTAVPNGPAHVRDVGPSHGADGSVRYVWEVSFPMLLTFRSSRQSTSMDVQAVATVVRMPEFVNHDGLGVRQIILNQN